MNLLDKKREEHLCRALQRVGSVLVCISLLLALAFPPQPAKAIAVADDVAIAAIVAAFLASCGMTLHASGMDNTAIAQQVYDMTGDFVNAHYGTPEERQQWYDNVKDVGFKDGLLLIGSTAAAELSELARWVKGEFCSSSDNSAVYSFSGRGIELSDGLTAFFFLAENTELYGTIFNYNDFPLYFKNGYYLNWEYENVKCCGLALYDSRGNIASHGEFYGKGRSLDFFTDHPIGLFLWNGGNIFAEGYEIHEGHFNSWNLSKDISKYISVTDLNSSLAIDSSDISIPSSLPDTQELTISTGAASDLTLDQALEQILAAIAAGELSATKEIAEAGTATGEATVPVDEAFPDVGELGLPALGNTLTTRFPFSIPWDIAKAVRLLAAPAKTPRFEVDFMAPIAYRFGGKLGNTKIVLDFSEYEIIGQVSRWASTIGFCLLLASGTKKLIWTA